MGRRTIGVETQLNGDVETLAKTHHQEDEVSGTSEDTVVSQEEPKTVENTVVHQEEPEAVENTVVHQEEPEAVESTVVHQEEPEAVESTVSSVKPVSNDNKRKVHEIQPIPENAYFIPFEEPIPDGEPLIQPDANSHLLSCFFLWHLCNHKKFAFKLR